MGTSGFAVLSPIHTLPCLGLPNVLILHGTTLQAETHKIHAPPLHALLLLGCLQGSSARRRVISNKLSSAQLLLTCY